MRKKMLAAIAAGIAILALGGCRRATPQELVEKASENAQKAESFTGNMEMSMTIKAKQDGMSMGLDIGMDLDIEATNDPSEYHMAGTLGVDFMDMNMDLEVYGVENEDKTGTVIYSNIGGQWSQEEVENIEESGNADIFKPGILLPTDSELKLRKELEKENGKDVFVIDTVVDGETFQEAGKMADDMLGETYGDIDFSDVEADMSIKIYRESMLPASVTMTVSDADSMIVEEDGTEVSLEALSLILAFDGYDTVEKITVPPEALASEETGDFFNFSEDPYTQNLPYETEEEPQADVRKDAQGNYILTDFYEEKEISIPAPEGMTLDEYADNQYLSFTSEEDAQGNSYYIQYSLNLMDEYHTEADYMEAYKSFMQEYQEEESYNNFQFQDETVIQSSGKEIKYIKSSYSYMDTLHGIDYVAWMVMEDNYILVCDISEFTDTAGIGVVSEDVIASFFKGI
ncbi:DUF6612 family protein [Luxibacter massiliensis]|uniref:DUF6612 family protein n=1 Tax=Luxibacter massiliensis TaxID=2219695 RepID=UPI000F06B024|nr:DUF6612 family protein [Luxibacter massiliensis]